MEVIRNINKIGREPNSVVTVGVFDGVHVAHQEILKRMKEEKFKTGSRTVLITFEPHPQEVLHQKEEFRILTTIDERVEILSNFDLDIVFVVNFTSEFSNMSAEEFCKDIMLDKIGARKVVVGYNHAFGRNREGNLDKLMEFGKRYGFEVEVVPKLVVENNVVSSSRIRTILSVGDVKLASKLLGRYYFINGVVVKGSGRGKKIGFPTANIEPASSRKLIPKNGVYIVRVTIGKDIYFGIMNIGYRPTFELDGRKVMEVNILNFDKEIYFRHIKVEFLERLRDEMKFLSPKELVKQIEEDREKALEYVAKEFAL